MHEKSLKQGVANNLDGINNGEILEITEIEYTQIGNEEILEIIDIELYAKEGKEPPKGVHYKIRIDKETYTVKVGEMTGQQILELAGKTPVTQYRLDMKLHGGAPKKIGLTEMVDFTKPGVERFMTLPLDQTEG